MNSKTKIAIMWFRRDLRIRDNSALFEAIKFANNNSIQIVPIFIFDTNILNKLKNTNDRRVFFIWESLIVLKNQLEDKGGSCSILLGDPCDVFKDITEKFNVSAVFCNEDYDQYSIQRDKNVASLLESLNSNLKSSKDHLIFSGNEVLKDDLSPYKVFTPYKRKWLSKLNSANIKPKRYQVKHLAPPTTHNKMKNKVTRLEQTGFNNLENPLKGGEIEAHKKLNIFLKKIDNYGHLRDRFGEQGTSLLSTYIRFGCVSVRQLVEKALSQDSEGASVWLSEIIWREFYFMILAKFPFVQKRSFKEKYIGLNFPGSDLLLSKWKNGDTGFPIIDAAMKHFSRTGMMHNRLRMIVASFLVKDLLVDWKKGEKHFAEMLLDYEIASNNGGWQWVASTGCDAQPYFRIFNPTSQSKKFDPNGDFIRANIPELKNFPAKYIHEPNLAPLTVQTEHNCIIGKDYPLPIVDHKEQRQKALKLYKIFND